MLEDAFFIAFGNTFASVGDGECHGAFGIGDALHTDVARGGELHGIAHQALQDAGKSLAIGIYGVLTAIVAECKFYSCLWLRHGGLHYAQSLVDGDSLAWQWLVAALVFRKLKELVYQTCHIGCLVADDVVILSFLLVGELDVRVGEQLNESEDLVERSANLVRHVSDERVFHLFCFLDIGLVLLAHVLRPLAVFLGLYAEMFMEFFVEGFGIAESACGGNLVQGLVSLQHLQTLHESHLVGIDVIRVLAEAEFCQFTLPLHHLVDGGYDGLVAAVHLAVEKQEEHNECRAENHHDSHYDEYILVFRQLGVLHL